MQLSIVVAVGLAALLIASPTEAGAQGSCESLAKYRDESLYHLHEMYLRQDEALRAALTATQESRSIAQVGLRDAELARSLLSSLTIIQSVATRLSTYGSLITPASGALVALSRIQTLFELSQAQTLREHATLLAAMAGPVGETAASLATLEADIREAQGRDVELRAVHSRVRAQLRRADSILTSLNARAQGTRALLESNIAAANAIADACGGAGDASAFCEAAEAVVRNELSARGLDAAREAAGRHRTRCPGVLARAVRSNQSGLGLRDQSVSPAEQASTRGEEAYSPTAAGILGVLRLTERYFEQSARIRSEATRNQTTPTGPRRNCVCEVARADGRPTMDRCAVCP